jgi:hypothetical protein
MTVFYTGRRRLPDARTASTRSGSVQFAYLRTGVVAVFQIIRNQGPDTRTDLSDNFSPLGVCNAMRYLPDSRGA